MISVIIPTFNAAKELSRLFKSLKAQTLWPFEILIVDSSSEDQTAFLARNFGAKVITLPKDAFDHGATRTLAAKKARGEFLIFLTQDAYPAYPEALERLKRPLEMDHSLALSFGRQLPPPGASSLASLDRLFNYPAVSRRVFPKDISALGLRAIFVSNSFACYRRAYLAEIGWFPSTPIAEDVLVAAKLLKRGYGLAYVAEAAVFHAHEFNLKQEWRRYFLLGRFHAQNPWLLKKFGRPEGEGIKYLLFGVKFLGPRAPHVIPLFLFRTFWRYLAYKTGFLAK